MIYGNQYGIHKEMGEKEEKDNNKKKNIQQNYIKSFVGICFYMKIKFSFFTM